MTPSRPTKPLTRRQFLRTGTQGLLGAMLTGAAASQAGCQPRSSPASATPAVPTPGRAKVVLVRGEQALDDAGRAQGAAIGEMLDAALRELTGKQTAAAAWGAFASAEERIAVKSNLMMRPVHVEVLYAVHDGLRGCGVADDNIAAWDRNQAGHGRAELTSLPRRPGFDGDDVSNMVGWASGLINLTGLKAHWLAGIGCAIKNWAGAVTNINVQDVGVSYAFHADSCADVGCLNAIPAIRDRCRLVIIDALRPLFHGGPQVNPEYVWDYRGLLVGTDPVAVDVICERILQARRDQYQGRPWPISPPAKHVRVADEKYGLGVSDPARIDLVRLGWEQGALV